MYKKGNTQLIAATILILTSVIFGFLLFNVGNRFINEGGIFARYHLMETSYIMETMLASPSPVSLDYYFDLRNFEFEFEDDKYLVKLGKFDSGGYQFTYDRNVKIEIEKLHLLNYFFRSSNLRFSNVQERTNNYLCSQVNTSKMDPIILIGINNYYPQYYNNLYLYYDTIRPNFNTYFQNLKNDNEIKIQNDLSIALTDSEQDIDVIIYFKPSKSNSKFACLLFNNLNTIEGLDMVLVPSNLIYSDIQINLNYDSQNVKTKEVQFPFKIIETIKVYFK